jgi:hypothetical protein
MRTRFNPMVTTVESVRARIPEPVKKVVNSGRFAYRRATQTKRVLSDFIIIGAQRCGTSTFYDLLSRHPAVIPAFVKEVEGRGLVSRPLAVRFTQALG